jgi:hypothetical protein
MSSSIADLVHCSLMNGSLINSLVDLNSQVGGNHRLSERIGGSACVLALVLGVAVHDVQGDEAEVQSFTETRPFMMKRKEYIKGTPKGSNEVCWSPLYTLLDGLAVVQPFYGQVGI